MKRIYEDYKQLISQLIEKSGTTMYTAATAEAILKGLKEAYEIDSEYQEPVASPESAEPEPLSKREVFNKIKAEIEESGDEIYETTINKIKWIRELRQLGEVNGVKIGLREAKEMIERLDFDEAVYVAGSYHY